MIARPARLGRGERLLPALIALAALVALHPVLRNGFLVVGFDDNAFILENPYIRAFTWENVWACLSQIYFHDYLPLPMLSYLLEFQLWGAAPIGYHLTNLLLHIANAVLVYAVSCRALASKRAGMFAGLIFAIHPVQLEVVSLVAQRKTLLATGFVLATLAAYQLYCTGRRRWYPVACLLYLAACASKASVVPFPFLLLLYDYTFQRPRVSLRDKLPFFGLAVITTWVSTLPKADVAVKAPQGGSYLATALAMSRVMWEYLDAMLLPLNLSPSYYYSPRDIFGVINWSAAAVLIGAAIALLVWQRRVPLTCFFAGWVVLSLLPVSNIVPIAVLRADRYLYLPMVAFALWAGAGMARVQSRSLAVPDGWRQALKAFPCAALLVLTGLSWQYAFVWRCDITAWTRVVDRHPWNSRAHYLLALSYAQGDALEPARRAASESVRIDPNFDRAHALLAEVYHRLGDDAAARDHEQQVRVLAGALPGPRVGGE